MRRLAVLFVPTVMCLLLPAILQPAAAQPVAARPAGVCGLGTAGQSTVLPVGIANCVDVRPGMSLFTEGLGGLLQFCTANFVFHGSDGNRYLGTAGHCSGASEGTRTVYPPGGGPFADNASAPGMPRIGEYAYVVYTNMNDLSRIRDFALIRLKPNVAAMASVCYFGGPTGIATGVIQSPFVVHHVGNGIGFGLLLRARSGVATGVTDPNWGAFLGLGIPGDSGSPVLHEDGRALGVLVQAHALPVSGSGFGDNVYVRLQPMMDAAEAALAIHLTLDTAPV